MFALFQLSVSDNDLNIYNTTLHKLYIEKLHLFSTRLSIILLFLLKYDNFKVRPLTYNIDTVGGAGFVALGDGW